MCSAVRVVVCAATHERQVALRRAAVGHEWQVVATVGTTDDAVHRVVALRARIVVVDGAVPGATSGEVAQRLRADAPDVLLVGVGAVAGAAAGVDTDGTDRLPAVLADVLHAAGDHTH